MSIPLPANPLHQRFADEVIKGANYTEAYLAANSYPGSGKKITRESASTQGKRWIKQPDVIAYITAIQKAAASDACLSLLEIRTFLARIVRVPVTALDPDDESRKDHDLLKKVKRRFSTDEETGKETTTEELEKHDPLKAIEIDLKLSGNDPESSSLKQIAEAIAKLSSSSPLPTGTL